ncbi:hypothetical protein [Candidatus Pantoea multigeneris]|uniref:Regulatory protein RecX n=1 Tax=Candidatus Pantoea multigeneris TaxID=2608357 RepID=A0ABX0RE03_9GAMM|nr:hypothetical protein [Pantoea multigeneris]NIF21689.1 hypothetical protein [Pantoea multigeneris]
MQQDEVAALLKDKSDFQKRLKLIGVLKGRTDSHSEEALQYLVKHDFVFKVRLAAWQALSDRGVTCDKPVERARYVIFLEKRLGNLDGFLTWCGKWTDLFLW